MTSERSRAASRFSAAGPALGYLAQVDYALLAMLEHMDDEDSFTTSIETLDDIVFHHADTDDATEKWQSKHSIDSSRSLSDTSVDLWKTINNWIVEPAGKEVRLVLLSTARAGTTASKLRTGKERDVNGALEGLGGPARESQSETNKPYYAAFLTLGPEERKALIRRVDIVDEAATAAN